MKGLVQREYRNVHGRRPTRGMRPWLLIPKVLVVACYIGGLAAVVALRTATRAWTDLHDPRTLAALQLEAVLFRGLVVPALLAAMLLGIGLFLQHRRVMLRQRWLQLKLLIVAIGVPTAHWVVLSRLMALKRAAMCGEVLTTAAEHRLDAALWTVLAVSVVVAMLGRLKPRLGQNWARAFGDVSARRAN